MNEHTFLLTVVFLFIVFFFFALLRATTSRRRKRGEAEKADNSKVGFIVGTFHELVAKLKEKEKELEDLRKKAEERADVIESYNEDILQSVPSGVISLDSSLVVTKINASAEKILNLKAAESVSKGYNEVFGEPLKSILDGKTVVDRKEVQYVTSSGKKVHLGLAITPLMNAKKEAIGQLMVFTDLTELKALEAQAELRDRLSSLGEMAAGMAHELRNPMGVIAGYTKLLSKKVDASLSHVVDSVAREVSVMDRIITDFLSFARPTDMNVSPVDIDALIRNCVTSMTGNRKDIRVSFPAAGFAPINGDEVLLRQAFTNLTQNAIEAMPQGGDLSFGVSAETESLEITISDSGHGIPEKIKDRIFLPFYTTKDKGTGLGLAIVHKIVVSHRGSISVESSEKGTTFKVRLPLKK
ncbi:MAG TPA: ATP-binding protein [Thermodesulfovibrionales bacterium]|nr:ATP-binding protein [Thermodesulfovibrionales bacterium]